jgi:hypothetical protein
MVSARAKRPVDRNQGSAARRLFIFGFSLYALRNTFDQPPTISNTDQQSPFMTATHSPDAICSRSAGMTM